MILIMCAVFLIFLFLRKINIRNDKIYSVLDKIIEYKFKWNAFIEVILLRIEI